MDRLVDYRRARQARFEKLANELGGSLDSILFVQVWRAREAGEGEAKDVALRVEAQSAISCRNESIRSYASLSQLCGVREHSMELIGDCQKKGATRLIEDLALADPRHHPCNLLPAGDELPACSALFLPIYDPADPFTRHRASGAPLPCAVLEVLVCKTAQMVHNHSDLMHAVCHVMDHYKVGVSADTTAFREWSRILAPPAPDAGVLTPRRLSPSTMSRSSSTYLLFSDSDDPEDALDARCKPQGSRKLPDQHRPMRPNCTVYSVVG